MFVDFCMFPDLQMRPPVFDQDFPRPAIVGITASPPIPGQFSTVETITNEVSKTVSVLENQPDVVVIRNIGDLDSLGNRIGVILGLQLPPFDATLDNIRELRRMGILSCTVAYKDEENPYGGGYMTDRPLTKEGLKFLRNLAATGIIADLSHACHRTAHDIIKFTQKQPGLHVMASHGGAYSVYDNPRNLPDDILAGIAEHGGIVGLYGLTFGLDSADCSFSPWIHHLDRMIEVCDIFHVALGTDGIYRQIPEDVAQAHFERMQRFAPNDPRWPIYLPTEPVVLNTPHKAEVIETKLCDLLNDDADAILAKNGLRFLREVLK